MAKTVNVQVEVTLSKVLQIARIVGVIAGKVGALATAAAGQVSNAKLTLTEIAGAAGTLTGIGALTGWQYSAIIGGLAVIFAVERNPTVTNDEKALAAKAVQLKKALTAAQTSGKLEVMVSDVLKTL